MILDSFKLEPNTYKMHLHFNAKTSRSVDMVLKMCKMSFEWFIRIQPLFKYHYVDYGV